MLRGARLVSNADLISSITAEINVLTRGTINYFILSFGGRLVYFIIFRFVIGLTLSFRSPIIMGHTATSAGTETMPSTPSASAAPPALPAATSSVTSPVSIQFSPSDPTTIASPTSTGPTRKTTTVTKGEVTVERVSSSTGRVPAPPNEMNDARVFKAMQSLMNDFQAAAGVGTTEIADRTSAPRLRVKLIKLT